MNIEFSIVFDIVILVCLLLTFSVLIIIGILIFDRLCLITFIGGMNLLLNSSFLTGFVIDGLFVILGNGYQANTFISFFIFFQVISLGFS